MIFVSYIHCGFLFPQYLLNAPVNHPGAAALGALRALSLRTPLHRARRHPPTSTPERRLPPRSTRGAGAGARVRARAPPGKRKHVRARSLRRPGRRPPRPEPPLDRPRGLARCGGARARRGGGARGGCARLAGARASWMERASTVRPGSRKCRIPREPPAPRRRASFKPSRALDHSGPPAAASLKP